MQKILKITKKCQPYDVIMTSRQHLKKYSALELTFFVIFSIFCMKKRLKSHFDGKKNTF